jgi:hypothetical protein
VERVVAVKERGAGRVLVTGELACGCRIEVEVDDERLIDTGGEQPLLVGKYPCPQKHPVRRPGPS